MTQQQIEEMRVKLQEQLRHDFFDKLKNDEDPSAERYELIGTVSKALERLLEIESGFLIGLLAESDDGLCPNCLIKDATDVANIKAVAIAFNHYLKLSEEMTH